MIQAPKHLLQDCTPKRRRGPKGLKKAKRSWDSIKSDLPDSQNDGSQTVVDGSLVHMDPWERVVGVV